MTCQCSPDNIAKTKYIFAHSLWKSIEHHPPIHGSALFAIRDAIKSSESSKNPRFVIESKVLLSQITPDSLVEAKSETLSQIIGKLNNRSLEKVKHFFTQKEINKYSKQYSDNGIKIKKILFKMLDNSYITTDKTITSRLPSASKQKTIALKSNVRSALHNKAQFVALKNMSHLSQEYQDNRFYLKSIHIGLEALKMLNDLIKIEVNADQKKYYTEYKVDLIQLIFRSQLHFTVESSLNIY